jgi:hypothetical protein
MANDDNGHDVQREVLQVLLEKVEGDRFPSVTMLDMIETILRPEDVERYTSMLLDKIRDDQFPSLDLLRRVQAFA